MSTWFLFSLINLLILPRKSAEANLVKKELSLEGNGGKEFELARQSCLGWTGSGRRKAWEVSLSLSVEKKEFYRLPKVEKV